MNKDRVATGANRSHQFMPIQILRSIAAMLVVFWHSELAIKLFDQNYWRGGDLAFRAEHYPAWANHLAVGVDIFFCISGFIMCMLVSKPNKHPIMESLDFITKRAVRIFPPYWLFTAIVIVVYSVAPRFNVGELTGHWAADAVRIINSMLLIPSFKGPVLLVGWTLIHELLFYSVVAAVLLIKQGPRLTYFLAVMALTGAVLSLLDKDIMFGYILSPYYIEFFMGALAYLFYKRIGTLFPHIQLLLALLIYFSLASFLDTHPEFSYTKLLQAVGFGSLGFLSITGLMGLDRKYNLSRFFLLRFMARLGDASYSLYLSHWLVLSCIGKFASLYREAPTYFVALWHALAIAASVIFGLYFSEYVELPFHKKLLRYLPHKPKKLEQ